MTRDDTFVILPRPTDDFRSTIITLNINISVCYTPAHQQGYGRWRGTEVREFYEGGVGESSLRNGHGPAEG